METLEAGGVPYAELWDELKSMEHALDHLRNPNWRLGDLDREQILALASLLRSLSRRSRHRPLYMYDDASYVLNAMQESSFPRADLRKEIRLLSDSPRTKDVFVRIGQNLPRLANDLDKAARASPTVRRATSRHVSAADMELVKTCLDSLMAYVAANLTIPHAEMGTHRMVPSL